MKRMIEAREEPIEMLLAELDYCLHHVGEQLPRLEGQVSEIQQICRAADTILNKIQYRLIPKR